MKFSAAAEMLPTKEAKLAMMAAPTMTETVRAVQVDPLNVEPQRNTRVQERASAQSAQREVGGQGEVWRNVAEIQAKLSSKLKTSVNAEESHSSLQLALENKELAARQERYVKALQDAGKDDTDIVGYAIAVNGKIASADVYASNGLFRKLWPRLLKSAATEAIGADEVKDVKAPAMDDVVMFLTEQKDAPEQVAKPVQGVTVSARASESAYDAETRATDGKFLHRSKLAR
jgi:hypothetical protein